MDAVSQCYNTADFLETFFIFMPSSVIIFHFFWAFLSLFGWV